MPSNPFNPQLSDVSANTFIQDSKVDTTAADVFTLAANTGVEVGKHLATSKLTGGSGSPDEVGGDTSLLPDTDGTAEEQSRALESITDLKKLSAARKAGLPLAQAKSRATRILKNAINDNPFFADDIRKEYQSFFGGSGASIFKMTPQEEEVAKYEARVSKTSMELGISEEGAIARIQEVEELKFQKDKMGATSQERALEGDDYVAYAQVSSSLARTNYASAIISVSNSTNGLTAADQAKFMQQLPLLESQLHNELFKLQTDENGKPRIGSINAKARENARREIDDTIQSLKGLVQDTSMQELLSTQQSNMKHTFDIIALKNFGAIKVVNDALGPEFSKYVIQRLQGNKSYRQLMDEDPYFAGIVSKLGDWSKDVADWGGVGLGAMFGADGYGRDKKDSTVVDKQKEYAGTLLLMSGDGGSKIVEAALETNDNAPSVFSAAVAASPGSLFNLTKPEYAAKINKNPEKWREVMEKSIESVRRSTLANYMVQQGGVPTNFDIQALQDGFSPEKPSKEAIQSASRIRASGDGMEANMQANINTIYKVAVKYPMLWEGKYDSSLDYIRSIFNLESGVRQK